MTAPAVIVTDADALRQLIREEVAAALEAATPTPAQTAPTLDPTRYYTVPEFAEARRCGRTAVYAAVRSGRLPHVRTGARISIPETALSVSLDGVA